MWGLEAVLQALTLESRHDWDMVLSQLLTAMGCRANYASVSSSAKRLRSEDYERLARCLV